MSDSYDFHYQPTGSGAISGQQVLQQTEDAINELGDYVNDNVGGAMDVAQQALETAQTAETNAQTALDTANSFSDAIQSAQQDASTALSAAQTAGTTAGNAYNLAVTASQDASNALTASGNAVSAVNTLSNTVTALGQQLATDEQSISNNASAITGLTTRMGTAENNINTLNTDVGVAMGNASSAMATAGTVKQQAYVLRYSSASVTDNSTVAYSTLDNTDNIKSGDKVIDVDGKIFAVVSVDTANQTVTVGSALIDLALDSNVVHTSGNETVGGIKTFTDSIQLKSNVAEYGVTGGNIQFYLMDKNNVGLSKINQGVFTSGVSYIALQLYARDSNNQTATNSITYQYSNNTDKTYLLPTDTNVDLGSLAQRWGKVYGIQYYYGNDNVEFSTKFVTSDATQTVSGAKTFSENLTIYNNDSSQSTKNLVIRSAKVDLGDSNFDTWGINFNAGASYAAQVSSFKDTSATQNLQLQVRTKDGSNNYLSSMVRLRIFTNGNSIFSPSSDNYVSLGSSFYKWKDVNTYLVNGLTPSGLSMPDIANKIDISSYITDLTGVPNEYTPTVNGWICVRSANTTKISILDTVTSVGTTNISPTATYLGVLVPCVANRKVYINIICTSLEFAYFIPCQGNV